MTGGGPVRAVVDHVLPPGPAGFLWILLMVNWIKIREDLPDDIEVLRMSEITGRSQNEIIGGLVRFWIWVSRHLVSERCTGVTLVTLDSVTDIADFGKALLAVGWLRLPTGSTNCIEIPSFDRWFGFSTKKRDQANERVRKHRETQRKCNAHVTQTQRKCNDVTQVDEEEEEEEEKNTPLPPKGGRRMTDPWAQAEAAMTGTTLRTDAFRAAWLEWVEYRRQARKPLTPASITRQVRVLEVYGHDGAIESIGASIRNGWQGLFDPAGRVRDRDPRRLCRVEAEPGKYDGIEERHRLLAQRRRAAIAAAAAAQGSLSAPPPSASGQNAEPHPAGLG